MNSLYPALFGLSYAHQVSGQSQGVLTGATCASHCRSCGLVRAELAFGTDHSVHLTHSRSCPHPHPNLHHFRTAFSRLFLLQKRRRNSIPSNSPSRLCPLELSPPRSCPPRPRLEPARSLHSSPRCLTGQIHPRSLATLAPSPPRGTGSLRSRSSHSPTDRVAGN